MQEGVGLRAKPNAVGCGRGVAALYMLGEAVEGRRSASGVGAPTNHRPVTGEETRGQTPFYAGGQLAVEQSGDARPGGGGLAIGRRRKKGSWASAGPKG
jgi:hypothetical protein